MPDPSRTNSPPRSSGDRPDAPDDAPEPQAPSKAAHAGGFTLDLSSGPASGQPDAWRRKRKQASPVLTKIVDLTAPKPEKPAPKTQAKPPHEKPPREKRREDGRERGKKPGGATLADLLDQETLARLRGGK